jgi:L-alanine-DL-glutamate epimerase-like enolase superfamily enzyme
MIERGAVEIVQADIGKCGGVTEFLKIAALADSYGLPMCPHNNPLIDVPCVAAIPNGLFHEYVATTFEAIGKVITDSKKPAVGMAEPSGKPGFGIEMNVEAIENFYTKQPSRDQLRRITAKSYRWPPYL